MWAMGRLGGGDGARRTWACHLFGDACPPRLWRRSGSRDGSGQGHSLTHSEGEPCGRLFRKGRASARVVKLADRDQVQAGLNLLCDLDWVRAVEKRPRGDGRPTTFYEINPRALR